MLNYWSECIKVTFAQIYKHSCICWPFHLLRKCSSLEKIDSYPLAQGRKRGFTVCGGGEEVKKMTCSCIFETRKNGRLVRKANTTNGEWYTLKLPIARKRILLMRSLYFLNVTIHTAQIYSLKKIRKRKTTKVELIGNPKTSISEYTLQWSAHTRPNERITSKIMMRKWVKCLHAVNNVNIREHVA